MEEDAKELKARYARLVEPNILDLFGRLNHSEGAIHKLRGLVLTQSAELAQLKELFRRLGVDTIGI